MKGISKQKDLQTLKDQIHGLEQIHKENKKDMEKYTKYIERMKYIDQKSIETDGKIQKYKDLNKNLETKLKYYHEDNFYQRQIQENEIRDQ